MKEMEKAITSFKNGTCSEKEALNTILTAIFRNKTYFGLEKLDEDNFSDYLLFLQERLPHFMHIYEPQKSKFPTYLRKICLTLLRSWYRQYYRMFARDIALTSYAIEEEMSSAVEETQPDYPANDGKDEDNEFSQFLNNLNRKLPIQTKLMMLALKSATFLTPSLISKICRMAEITEAELYEKLDIINRNMDKKLEKQRHLLQLQNEAYIIRKESDIQMSILNPESSHYRDAGISRNYHDKLWKSRLERTRSTHDVYPTNSLVSEVLDVPLGQVTHIFSAVRHKMDGSKDQKEVSYEYDYLRSNRKPSQEKGTSGDTHTSYPEDSKR